jgi:hypothetical protein
MPDSPLRKNPILNVLRKFMGSRHESADRPIECVFSLNPQKRKLHLLDLKAILRLPDARLALPNVANLEVTIKRNHERIRIPYDAMLPLVRELLSVRHRVPSRSPLVEIMTAVPGLVNTIFTGPVPTSALLAGKDIGIRMPPIPQAEQEAEVARIRELIANNKPAPQVRPASDAGIDPAELQTPALPQGSTDVAPRILADNMLNSKSMTAVDQRRYLENSADLIESVALSTHELSDEDMSGYIDLCILNGDHDRVVSMLVERVADQPRAWAWMRLLELAEAMRDPRFAQLRTAFLEWAQENHPELIPESPAAAGDLFYGVRKEALRAVEDREMAARPAS